MKRLHKYFECKVDVPRVRIGNRQTIETLISEETLLFAKYVRSEIIEWTPRIPWEKQIGIAKAQQGGA